MSAGSAQKLLLTGNQVFANAALGIPGAAAFRYRTHRIHSPGDIAEILMTRCSTAW
ncbi:hypothetical protein ACL02S_21060 [Nocardia sp. 004]|uniref:hypothetical protein n=1 Tax=Nocardia sp. 004 TaxID=3385978 RepID=UPI00399EE96B